MRLRVREPVRPPSTHSSREPSPEVTHAMPRVLIGCLSGLSLLLVCGPAAGQPRPYAGVEAPPFQSVASLRDSSLRDIDFQQAAGQQQPERRHDSLNGVLMGAGVGALWLDPQFYDDCEECHDSLYASIAVGAGIRLLIDALRFRAGRPCPEQRPTPPCRLASLSRSSARGSAPRSDGAG